MNAAEVKDKVRARHPATQRMGIRTIPGVWTVLEEAWGIDVLAFSAYKRPPSPKDVDARHPYPRVGYEVKVSRSDMRTELLHPEKRAGAVARTNQFYFAVPKELLTDEEIAWEQPEHFDDPATFARIECPDRCGKHGRETKGKVFNQETFGYETCGTCDGKAYVDVSRVEKEAPTLWVPPDVGLLVVDGRGTRVVKRAPASPVEQLDSAELADLVRWVSARPDPRHIGVVERAREVMRELRGAA